jgi:hypothetical protein
MTPHAENQVLFCRLAMKGWIGKGEGMGGLPGNMGIRMADYAVEAGGRTAYPGYAPLAPLLQKIFPVALGALVGGGAVHHAMIPAVEGNPTVRMFT